MRERQGAQRLRRHGPLGGHDGQLAAARRDDAAGDDDEVAHVHVGSECRLVLAAQERRDVAGKTAENNVLCVNDEPVALDVFRLG